MDDELIQETPFYQDFTFPKEVLDELQNDLIETKRLIIPLTSKEDLNKISSFFEKLDEK